jgi:hypothetical protein
MYPERSSWKDRQESGEGEDQSEGGSSYKHDSEMSDDGKGGA